jgi:hypothetical protein
VPIVVAAVVIAACADDKAPGSADAAMADAALVDASSGVDVVSNADGNSDAARTIDTDSTRGFDSADDAGDVYDSEALAKAVKEAIDGKNFAWLPEGSLHPDGTKAVCRVLNSLHRSGLKEGCTAYCGTGSVLVDCESLRLTGMCKPDEQCVIDACLPAPACTPGTYTCLYEDDDCQKPRGVVPCGDPGAGVLVPIGADSSCEVCEAVCPKWPESKP